MEPEPPIMSWILLDPSGSNFKLDVVHWRPAQTGHKYNARVYGPDHHANHHCCTEVSSSALD